MIKISCKSPDVEIGEILMQYYSGLSSYYGKEETPIIRFRYITIKEQYRRKHHAARAIETMLVSLRKSKAFPKNTHIKLECNNSKFDGALINFYKKFGFAKDGPSSFGDVDIMKVKLTKTKFPYYKSVKSQI